MTVFEGYNGVDAQLVASWIDYLAGAPRMAPLIPDDAPFLAGFERSLAQYTGLPPLSLSCVCMCRGWVFAQ